jgi:hypothetical protein
LAIFDRAITARAFQYWKRSGRPTVWAACAIRDYIRARCAVGLQLAAQLDEYVADRERADALKHQKGRLRNRGLIDE